MDKLRASHAKDIDSVGTFVTKGLDDAESRQFLATRDGQQLLKSLQAADPKATPRDIAQRAIDQLRSGREKPKIHANSTPLVKIVPEGQSVSPYSPFFTTQEELDKAVASGVNLGEYFGIPIKSQARVYDVYQITPTTPGHVFTSTVAPTSELGGLVRQSGGAAQTIVPNRGCFSKPVHIGKITN